jgi:hypothetical protein
MVVQANIIYLMRVSAGTIHFTAVFGKDGSWRGNLIN